MPNSSHAHKIRRSIHWKRELPAIGTIAVFFLVFFGWILKGRIFLVGGDAFAYSYPLRTVAWRMIREGELPLWTPAILCGYPLLSMSQVGLAYPVTWLYLLLPGHMAEEVFVLTPFLLAPIFTYLYVRVIGRSRPAALLAALSYGYGGMTIGLLGVVGIMPNSLLWLPLMLVALEFSRTRRFIPCLLGATATFGLSVFSGLAQGFLFVALVSFCYALFLTFVMKQETESIRERFRPLGVCLLSCFLGVSLGAWQILETARAASLSIRSTLIYPFFISGSFSPLVALKSLLLPLYTDRFADVSTYVAPLAMLLALYAIVTALRHRAGDDHDSRIYFWTVVAMVACVLILGKYTPVYRLLYYVPIFNLFRVPSRHSFEWTFAISVLAAYGWDLLRNFAQYRSTKDRTLVFVCSGLLVVATLIGFGWGRATGIEGLFAFTRAEGVPRAWSEGLWYSGLSLSSYGTWKTAFTVATTCAILCGLQVASVRRRQIILAASLLLVCFVEPFIVVRNWWHPFAKTAERFTRTSIATRWLQANLKPGARVYPRVELFADEFTDTPRVDAPNLTMLSGWSSVGGYEPLFLDRYSKALGDVNLDAVSPLPGTNSENDLFKSESHVLDLLSTQFVVTYDPTPIQPSKTIAREGLQFDERELLIELHQGEVVSLRGAPDKCDTLALVTSLANSSDIAEGTPVAKVRVLTHDSQTIDLTLRAGQDTAEWAHERPDVRQEVKHKLAPVFDSSPVSDAGTTYPGNRYWTRLRFGSSTLVDRVEIEALSQHASLAVWKATLFDSINRTSYSLSHSTSDTLARINVHRWRQVFDDKGVSIFENQRALPRAWLVAGAKSVSGEEALQTIRGGTGHQFDPERIALLEVPPNELPQLPGGPIIPNSKAMVVSYRANDLVIETDAPTPAVLVVSDVHYPGWEAKVDGNAVRLMSADYVLRGVAVPAGQHRIEMRYRAPLARVGAAISLAAVLGLFVCLGFHLLHMGR